jgi:hypothetical protein
MGQKMEFIGIKAEKTEAGYERTLSRYQARNCNGCQMRCMCHKSKGNRIIEVSHRLNELKAKARDRLLSEKGIMHRKKRPVDVEPVFGMLKQNKSFRRFFLKGIDKVSIEFGLLALAHNIKKISDIDFRLLIELKAAFSYPFYCSKSIFKLNPILLRQSY